MSLNKASIEGVKLTENFWIKEFFEGTEMPSEAIRMNYNEVPIYLLPRLGSIARELQHIRNRTRQIFGDRFKGIEITSGVRVKNWELIRGRSGNSQHVQLWAADFRPICDEEDFDEIIQWIFDHCEPTWKGGFAISKKGKFIHADLRGYFARWEY